MPKSTKQKYRYSICCKQKVVEEIRTGLSVTEVSLKYGIKGGNTVRNWVRRYGYPGMLNEVIYVKMKKETEELKALHKEVERLKIALADKAMAYDALEILLEEAGIDQESLKKNIGCRSFGVVTKKGGGV
ncbi:MAG: transposase [Prevotellaceae bacterium]|jgi:transposase-like protein|nr:transposase [Prevotellaceae bacterium]